MLIEKRKKMLVSLTEIQKEKMIFDTDMKAARDETASEEEGKAQNSANKRGTETRVSAEKGDKPSQPSVAQVAAKSWRVIRQ